MKKFTGLEIKDSEKAPVGFYRHTNETYKGLIFKDKFGQLTYFDIISNAIYPATDVWNNSVFTHDATVSIKIKPETGKIKITALTFKIS